MEMLLQSVFLAAEAVGWRCYFNQFSWQQRQLDGDTHQGGQHQNRSRVHLRQSNPICRTVQQRAVVGRARACRHGRAGGSGYCQV